MTNRRIIVITRERRLTRTVRRSLVSAGCVVDSDEVRDGVIDPRLTQSADMFIVDADLEFEDVSLALKTVTDDCPTAPVLLVSRNLHKSQVLEQVLERGLNNLIARHGGVSASHHHLDEGELITTVDKLLRQDIFGIEKYLPQHGIEVRKITLTHTNDRKQALAELDGFLTAIDCYEGIQPLAIAAADELLMNAIFSAPRDENGKAKYDQLDRNTSLELEPNEHVDLQYACDGRSVFMAVNDRFGSLNRERLVKYLSLGSSEKGTAENKKGGAGLGLFLVVRSLTQLVFNIERNKRTEVIASLYIRGSRKQFLHSGQSLNMFIM